MKKQVPSFLMIILISICFFSCQKSAEEYYSSGIALSQEHNIESSIDAIECFDSAISLNPNFALAYLNRGRVRFEIQNIRNILNSNDKFSYELPKELDRMESDSLFEQSILDYDKALELDPNLAKDVLIAKGYAFIIKEDYTQALSVFESALDIDSTNKSIINSMVSSMLSLKDTVGTKLFLSKIVDYNYKDSEVYYLRAIQKIVALGDKTGGCEDLAKAQELYNSDTNYINKNLKNDIEKLIKINCKMYIVYNF